MVQVNEGSNLAKAGAVRSRNNAHITRIFFTNTLRGTGTLGKTQHADTVPDSRFNRFQQACDQ
jgi:hypothetical protein